MKLFLLTFIFVSFRAYAAEIFYQGCHVIGEDDYVQYHIETENEIKPGANFHIMLTAFEDENCEKPYLRYNQYFRVTKSYDHILDLQTAKITYTSLTDEVTQALNSIEYCGYKNWISQNEVAVTGKICDDYQQLATDQMLFQIIKQQENQIQIGKIGKNFDGRKVQNRPIEYDLIFTKVMAKPGLHVNRIPF